MPFNRPPRIQTPLPSDEVVIPSPQNVPSKPGEMAWLTTAMPLVAVVITMVLILTLGRGGSSAFSYLFFLPMMLLGTLGSVITARIQRRSYRTRLEESRREFAEALEQVEDRLQGLQRREQEIRLEANPDPRECLQRAHRQDPRLGERRPEDADFLAPRLGIGEVPAAIQVKASEGGSRLPELAQEFEHADRLLAAYPTVPDVPVTARLVHTGSIGIAGARETVMAAARALVCQIATHHWPTEVQLAVISQAEEAGRWKWTHLLPHATGSVRWRTVPRGSSGDPLAEVMTSLEAELHRRQKWIEARAATEKSGDKARPPTPYLLVLVDGYDPSYAHPALSMLLQSGAGLGVLGVFLTERPQQIPGACGAILEVRGETLTYRETGPTGFTLRCRPDQVDPQQAEALARALASIEWPQSDDMSQPPATITFLEMLGAERVEDVPVADWWERETPYGYLRAPIGRTSSTADLVFDLNDKDGSHGPHGLIGGMTGSGKSEVLKTLVLALAITHHPYDINFALIDYKGGAAFNELARLPHTVGVVTDIETHATYGERVILALAGEIERRKRLLEQARKAFEFGRSHIDEYRRLRVKRPLPRLVIIFDEFAEFKQRYPEESKRLITIARQGRSLGVHLILATQNIQAAVDPQILQNSSFRICLRVSEPQDSTSLIGVPDAIHLSRGRAYFSAQTRQLLQFAYSGAAYAAAGNGHGAGHTLVRVWPDGRRETISLPADDRAAGGSGDRTDQTEAGALIDHLSAVARQMRLRRPSHVWLDPLPDRLYLPELQRRRVRGGWDGTGWKPFQSVGGPAPLISPHWPILGLFDHPAQQKQQILQPRPDTGGGHLLLFGSSGSGKSTLLRTLVTSVALAMPPDLVHFYLLDLGVQSPLKVLEALPHVGAVITRLEVERAERLIQYLHSEVARRTAALRKVGVDSWIDHNAKVAAGQRLPMVYILIDGFQEFKRILPPELVGSLASLVSGGQSTGVYFVIASNLQADLPNELFANINLRMTFHQADQTEYFRIVGQPSPAKVEEDVARGPTPGRGLLRGTPPLEFQTALPCLGETDRDQAENLARLCQEMKRAWKGPTPAPIRSLPFLVTLPEAVRPAGQGVGGRARLLLLGQDYETLASSTLSLDEDGPTFLIAGVTPQTGKTTLLRSLVLGLAERHTAQEVVFAILDFHVRTLAAFRKLPHVRHYVGARPGLAGAIEQLLEEIQGRQVKLEQSYEADPDGFQRRSLLGTWPHLFVAIDDYQRFAAQAETERRQLVDCLARGGELGVSFLIAGNIAELPPDYDDPFVARMRKHGCGVLLGGTEGIEHFNNARRPPGVPAAGLPPGRGLLVRRGAARLFQAAAFWQVGENPEQALLRRVDRIAGEAERVPS